MHVSVVCLVPAALCLQAAHEVDGGYIYLDAHVLCTPAIADIDGDGQEDLVLAVSYFYDRCVGGGTAVATQLASSCECWGVSGSSPGSSSSASLCVLRAACVSVSCSTGTTTTTLHTPVSCRALTRTSMWQVGRQTTHTACCIDCEGRPSVSL